MFHWLWQQSFDRSSGLPLIVFAGLAMYIASKALADALTAGDTGQPGRLAIGHWIPIAVLAVAAVMVNHADISVGLIFASSVACLSLAAGAVVFLQALPVTTAARQSWAMLVPAGLLAFLVGLHGSISLFNAAIFAVQGLCVLILWNDGPPKAMRLEPLPVARPGRGMEFRVAQFALAAMLAAVGAWLALHGIGQVSAHSEFATAGLLTATLIAPLLVLPIIGTGTELSQTHQSAAAVSSQIGVALLNICALVPLIVLAAYFKQIITAHGGSADLFGVLKGISVPFPLAVWRVDVLVLMILALFLLPVSLGRFSLARAQGLLMMLGYAVYLAMSLAWQEYCLRGVPMKAHP